MKTQVQIVALLALLLSLASCGEKKATDPMGNTIETPQEPEKGTVSDENGEKLFLKSNCASCHKVDAKVVGPSLQEIAKIYKEKSGNIVSFLKEEAEPIVDKSQYNTMKANFAVTKNMSDDELKSIELYILNQAK